MISWLSFVGWVLHDYRMIHMWDEYHRIIIKIIMIIIWSVVSNIYYFPFHIWDPISFPLTKSMIFQRGWSTTNQSYVPWLKLEKKGPVLGASLKIWWFLWSHVAILHCNLGYTQIYPAIPSYTTFKEQQHMGLSENRVYSQTNSHFIGIMISKTNGFRGTLFSDTPIPIGSMYGIYANIYHLPWLL